MYDLIKVMAPALLMPLPFLLLLVGLGLALIALGWRRFGFSVSVTGLVVLSLVSWAPVADRLLSPFESHYEPFDVEADLLVGSIVVLGGGWFPDNDVSASAKLSESSLFRLIEGVRIWRQFPEATLFLSGASRNPDVAPVAKGYFEAAIELGLPKDAMVMLDTPTDTVSESKAFKIWHKHHQKSPGLVVLVTSASHMPRAMRYFQLQQFQPIAAPTPCVST